MQEHDLVGVKVDMEKITFQAVTLVYQRSTAAQQCSATQQCHFSFKISYLQYLQ